MNIIGIHHYMFKWGRTALSHFFSSNIFPSTQWVYTIFDGTWIYENKIFYKCHFRKNFMSLGVVHCFWFTIFIIEVWNDHFKYEIQIIIEWQNLCKQTPGWNIHAPLFLQNNYFIKIVTRAFYNINYGSSIIASKVCQIISVMKT